METKKSYKLWHMLVAFVVGALVASAVILVPAMGGAGFLSVKTVSTSLDSTPVYWDGLDDAKDLTLGTSSFDTAASDHYATLEGLEMLYDSTYKRAYMFAPGGNAFVVTKVDPSSVDLKSLSARDFYDCWPTIAGIKSPDSSIRVGLSYAKDYTFGSDSFESAANAHFRTLDGLEVLYDSTYNRAYLFGEGGALYRVSKLSYPAKVNYKYLSVRNFYDCWPKSL